MSPSRTPLTVVTKPTSILDTVVVANCMIVSLLKLQGRSWWGLTGHVSFYICVHCDMNRSGVSWRHSFCNRLAKLSHGEDDVAASANIVLPTTTDALSDNLISDCTFVMHLLTKHIYYFCMVICKVLSLWFQIFQFFEFQRITICTKKRPSSETSNELFWSSQYFRWTPSPCGILSCKRQSYMAHKIEDEIIFVINRSINAGSPSTFDAVIHELWDGSTRGWARFRVENTCCYNSKH